MKKKFTDSLPDLSKSPVPYPNPQNAGEVCANRLAARQSGAVKHHYFPLTAPDQQTWTALLERVAMLEDQVSNLQTYGCAVCSKVPKESREQHQ